jgi:cellulose biosynthesis protein BcsQ
MKIIAVTNIKGGVGKTTAAVNLAYLCAAGGRATLLWDLDPQGSATYTLRAEAHRKATAKKLLAGKRELPDEPPAARDLRRAVPGLPGGYFAVVGERAAGG